MEHGQSRSSRGVRLLVSAAAGLGTAVVAGIALTILDMYRTGHGLGSISRPLVDWPTLGVHLSLADIVMLIAAGLAAFLAWRRRAPGGA